MIRRTIIYFLIIFFAYSSSIYAMGETPPHKYIPIRVLVVKDAKKIDIRIKGSYRFVGLKTGETLEEGESLKRLTISVKDIDSEGMKILTGKKSKIYINKRQFRGEIDIVKRDLSLLVINRIDLEEYLYGVLYHEVSHRWPIEVLKAQAVAARTYALYQKLVTKNKYYDLSSDIYSQVYGGRFSETRRTRKAVDLTIGMVLTQGDKVFPSYYHATCGGKTSDVETLWNIDVPALRGRKCGFCDFSPHYIWKRELTINEVDKSLKGVGHDIQLTSIEVLNRDDSGRILNLLLKGKKKNIELSGNKFRLAVGPNIVRSANFDVQIKGNIISFQGKGWGHGIGMCQWGAYGMAREGWKAEDILEHYYPGASLTRVE
ncbi:SpoIID/LytB domain-containing protein [Candidatus Omnitrophota bacterium]